ncbi:MAG: hypothetical protein NVS3B26_16670 [Mycobacteriales bacterium]
MTYRPEEIARKIFVTTLRGYDRIEVQAYLRAVAEDYAEALDALAGAGVSPGSQAPPRPLRRAFLPGSLDVSLVLRPDTGITFTVRSTPAASTDGGEIAALRAERAVLLQRIDELQTAASVRADQAVSPADDTV